MREEEDRAPERGSAVTGASVPVIDVGQQLSYQFDSLFRGDRELVASMGLMHYSMFVYTISCAGG